MNCIDTFMKNTLEKEKVFTFVDLFAGIGGFHQALKVLGGKCVAACEIDENARTTYLANHNVPKNAFFKDIHQIDIKKIPNHDILCAGFPCQPFSISGKQNALEDVRSSVISALFDIIREKKPKVVILENVKKIKYVSGGKAFNYIISSLEKLNYQVSYKLLNAKDFGVAQNRERWIFIGVLGDEKYQFKNQKSELVLLKEVLQRNGQFTYLEEPYTLLDNPKTQPSGLRFVGYRKKKIRTNGVREGTIHLSRVHKQPNRIYSIYGIHPTIPSQESSGRFWILLDNGKVRKMTVKECFRIMGFDDSFKKPVSEANLYKQIGNSVCVPMIKSIVGELLFQIRFNNE